MVKTIGGIISLICFLYVVISAWTSAMGLLAKVIWTLVALIPGFNIITAIAYFFLGGG